MDFGQQTARILKNYVGVNERTGNMFINLKCALPSGETVFVKVWLTDKSYGMARQQLKKCGFDVDAQNLSDVDSNDELLAGNEVLLDVYEEEYPPDSGKMQTRTQIVIESLKAPADKLARATEGLRNAKKANRDAQDAPAEGSDPNDLPF